VDRDGALFLDLDRVSAGGELRGTDFEVEGHIGLGIALSESTGGGDHQREGHQGQDRDQVAFHDILLWGLLAVEPELNLSFKLFSALAECLRRRYEIEQA